MQWSNKDIEIAEQTGPLMPEQSRNSDMYKSTQCLEMNKPLPVMCYQWQGIQG
jgi:hypothetical protein